MIKSSTYKYPQTLLLLITLRVTNSRDLANNLAGIRVLKKKKKMQMYCSLDTILI